MSVISINGTISLFVANILGKIFGAVYRIPLSNMLGAEGMGLYQMAFPIYSFLLTFITGGVSVTLSRKIASLRAKGDVYGIYKNYVVGKKLCFVFGIILTFFIVVFAYPLAFLQGNTLAVYGYFAIAVGFVFAVLLGVYRGYFQGHGNMVPTAISQILEQGTKLIFGLILALFFGKYSVQMGVFGALLGISFGEIIAYIYFLIIKRKIKKMKVKIVHSDYRVFFRECLPISVSHSILPLSGLLDSFLVVNLLVLSGFLTGYSTSLYGIETGMILPLINIPNVLIGALSIACVPSISYKLSKGENCSQEIEKVFNLVIFFILPCFVGLFVLSKPIVNIVYIGIDVSLRQTAVLLLKFSVFEMFFLCFLTICNVCLQAINKTRYPIFSLLVAVIIKIVLTIIFVLQPNINIFGLVLASFVGYFVSTMLSMQKLKKSLQFSIKPRSIIIPCIGCAIMCIFIFLTIRIIGNIGSIYSLGTIILMSSLIYFAVTIPLGGLRMLQLKKLLQKEGK